MKSEKLYSACCIIITIVFWLIELFLGCGAVGAVLLHDWEAMWVLLAAMVLFWGITYCHRACIHKLFKGTFKWA